MLKQTVQDYLTEAFKKAAIHAFPIWVNKLTLPVEITQSTQDKFGHYQFNSAMRLAKMLQKNPRDVAQAIVQNLEILRPILFP